MLTEGEGWCYKHDYPFCMIPVNGQWHYACPICFKATETFPTNRTVHTDWESGIIYDMMVHGVPEKEESGRG